MGRDITESGAGMPLLTTRLRVPSLRGRLAPRRRLLELLDGVLQRKLILLSAPPGFGKTTLVAQWIRETVPAGLRTGWVSVDGDDDPVRFWSYCLAALEGLEPGIGQEAAAMLEARRRPVEAALTVLVNALAQAAGDFVLVLDDYDLVEAQSIHEQIAFLFQNLPPNLHLIVLSRIDPPLPLARLRLLGDMAEIRASDLSFSLQETAAFLTEVMGLHLLPAEIRLLAQRTEGWAAGLQAAALSLRGRVDAGQFIAAFAGSQRYVMDYLVEEVLSRQPEEIQSFLLQTSVADRLCGSLCNAITGRDDSEEVLDRLEGGGLFVFSIDDERRWYRYHHLFADMLRRRLLQLPEGAAPYHARAAAWFNENGLVVEATEHALAARDFATAAAILEPAARAILEQGAGFAHLARWLAAFPPEERRLRPELNFWYAMALFFEADTESFESPLAEAESGWREQNDATGKGSVLSLRAHIAWRRRDYEGSCRLAEQALALLPHGASFRRGLALHALGLAQQALGLATSADLTLREARALANRDGSKVGRWVVMGALAGVSAMRGKLRDAAAGWQELIDAGRDSLLSPVVEARVRLGDLQRELGHLAAAERQLRDAVAAAERAGLPDLVVLGLLGLARTAAAQGDSVATATLLDWAAEAARGAEDPELADMVAAHHVRQRLLAGDVTSAGQWALSGQYLAAQAPAYSQSDAYLTFSRYLIAVRDTEGALRLLRIMAQPAEEKGRLGQLVEIQALQALALDAAGQGEAAVRRLADALLLAQRESYVRTFLDEGSAMTRLLHAALARGVAPEYIAHLLAAAGGNGVGPESGVSGKGLVEPLSEREREVLSLIARGASNQEVAADLTIALTTAKKHISNIIGKLGASNRVQAVARARELGLL